MTPKVYANKRRVSAKKSGNKTASLVPNVCHSPPPPPATPNIGVPMPHLSFSDDSKTSGGTKTVRVNGQEANKKNKSCYKSSTGDEAATPGLQKGVISHKIGGKAHFTSWSFDVRYERTNVVRHQDMMTHNDRNC